MKKPAMSRRYALTLAVLWVAGGIAGTLYAQQQHIPTVVAVYGALAVLIEASLYASLAFEEVRCRWPVVPLVVFAPLPYMIYSTAAGVFSPWSMLAIWACAALAMGWFHVLPKGRLADFGFIVVMALPLLFKLFPLLYAKPVENLRLDILGQLLWIRLGVLSVLQNRPQRGVNFGFLPSKDDWLVGLRYGLIASVLLLPLALAVGFVTFGVSDRPWWLHTVAAAGTFTGILWVVALSEEFFFRGLIQQWLEQWWGSAAAAVAVTSILFGSVHLGFRHFPNWQFALLAGAAGVFYGLAFRRGGGIKAAMVAHALLVTVWRTAFR